MIQTPAGYGGAVRIKRYLDYYQPGYGPAPRQPDVFSPASLFISGEQGLWLDPSDFNTMFQDAAATTPVTAVEQSVLCILDKSGRGNSATQASSGSAPVISARVNLLTKTEDFSDLTAWPQPFGVITRTSGFTAPDGTNTAWQLVFSAADIELRSPTNGLPANAKHSVYIKGTVGQTIKLSANSNNSVTLTGDWQYYDLTSASQHFWIGTWDGSTARTVLVWHPDARVSNDGVGIPAYQRVTTSTDYDTVNFPFYLRFDGSNDSLVTGTITPGTNTAQVFAGVRKLSDAAFGMLVESSASSFSNPGTISIRAPLTALAGDYAFTSTGSSTSTIAAIASTYAAPITNVLTGIGAISTDTSILRVNGTQVVSIAFDQGTGNYLAYPFYIGRRAGTSAPFNGRLYSLIVRFGASLDATTLNNTETWVNGKTKAY